MRNELSNCITDLHRKYFQLSVRIRRLITGNSLFLSKILEHPDYRTADAKEKAFFKSKTKDVTDILPHIKQSLLTRYQKEYEEHLKQVNV